MNNFYKTFCILTLYLTCCSSSQSQTVDRIVQINKYCDSLDIINGTQTVRKVGAGVTLEYIISKGEVIKIIEQPSGYKFFSVKRLIIFGIINQFMYLLTLKFQVKMAIS